MIKSLLTSRKMWLCILAIAIPVINKFAKLEIDQTQLLAAIGSIIAVIFGIAWEDAARKSANGNGMKSPYKDGEK